jgi:hypothetical protein
MNKTAVSSAERIRMLNADEMKQISGGSVVNFLLRFASWGTSYFFNMGVREGRTTRAQL